MIATNNKRICILRHYYYPGCTRIEKEINALREAGYHVDVICLRRKGEKRIETIDNVTVHRIPHSHQRGSVVRYLFEYGWSFLLMTATLTLYFFRHRYACIQVNTMPDAMVFITAIPRLFGSSVLLDMHEPIPELWTTKYGNNEHSLLFKFQIKMEQWAIKYANKVITVNEPLRERYIERGANKAKIDIVTNVPDEIYAASAQPQNSGNGFKLLTHGTIEKRNGQEVIIRALPLLRDKIPNLHLFIVGDGEDRGRLEALSKKLGCFDLITFTGQIPFMKIGEVISRADIGLVPLTSSPWGHLCQPIKLFEYVGLRKPVVVSRLRAIEETFDDSCVIYFQPGDHAHLAQSILDLYRNPEKAQQYTANAYRRYQQIRWGQTKTTYLQIIKNLGAQE